MWGVGFSALLRAFAPLFASVLAREGEPCRRLGLFSNVQAGMLYQCPLTFLFRFDSLPQLGLILRCSSSYAVGQGIWKESMLRLPSHLMAK